MRYGPDGETLWSRRYDGPAHGEDEAYALELDDAGNVHVTGGSADSSECWDCLTIKYGPAGETLWVARYDGPGHDDDWADDLALDAAGNVYITGTSVTAWPDFDIVTIKYSSAGVEQWVRRHGGVAGVEDEANAIAVDGSGNVCVTGVENRGLRPDTASNLITIKYGPSGDTLWVSRLAGIVNGLDQGYDIAVDGSRNVYVTGTIQESLSQCITIKYGPGGETLWVRRYCGDDPYLEQNGTALALDDAGNVYVGGRCAFGTSGLDYLTVKYDAGGETSWVRTYNGPHSSSADWVNDIAVDDQGGVYVTGMSEQDRPEGEDDYATVKYGADGNEEWIATYNHPANGHDEAYAVVADNSGSIYVTGISGNDSYSTIKYTQAGAVVERLTHEASRATPSSTIVRGVLVLGAVGSRQNAAYRAAPSDGGRRGQLLDVAGRTVMKLGPGANDVSRLAPGVYFVRQTSDAVREASRTVRVIVTR